MSVVEVARLTAAAGEGELFARALDDGMSIVRRDAGCSGVRVLRGVEEPEDFVLLVEWASVEAHQRFRDSDPYRRYRAAISPYLTGVPSYQHFRTIGTY